jgi:DNA polymerase-1
MPSFQLKLFAVELEKTQTNKLLKMKFPCTRSCMETEGINLDVSFLKNMSGEMQKEIDTFEQKNI